MSDAEDTVSLVAAESPAVPETLAAEQTVAEADAIAQEIAAMMDMDDELDRVDTLASAATPVDEMAAAANDEDETAVKTEDIAVLTEGLSTAGGDADMLDTRVDGDLLAAQERLGGAEAQEVKTNKLVSLQGTSSAIEPDISTPAVIPSAVVFTSAAPAPVAPHSVPTTSKLAQLEARISKNPLDGAARLALLHEVEGKGDLERTRQVYEDFLATFPDASEQWIAYCDLELSHGLFTNVEALFARCLRPSPSVPLWKFYLDYIRRVNPFQAGAGGDQEKKNQARGVIGQSFEFALSHVGGDRQAGSLWVEWIEFLKQGGGGETRGTWEDQQRMDTLRKTYQRAVCIPLDNVEHIWQDYNSFENNLNKMTAKKFLSELSPSYMTARKALRELRAMFDHLSMPSLPTPPDWTSPTSTAREDLMLWKKYLAYEEANPLDIEEASLLETRVTFAYKKAVGSMRFFAEIWIMAANYYSKIGKVAEATEFVRSGMTANPSSMLLAYTLSDYEEAQNEFTKCHAVYDALLNHFHSQIADIDALIQSETAEALRVYESCVIPAAGGEDGGVAEDVETREKKLLEREEISSTIKVRHEMQRDAAVKAAANVWITEMTFARRAEGMRPARNVFTKARKSIYPTWQVIQAAATMELYYNKDVKVATNVFELGLKSFGSDVEYIMQYLEFLIQSNNDSNARALFERTVAKIEPEKAKPIWDRWMLYEYQYGDFPASQKLAARYSESFPEVSATERFLQRYGYQGLTAAIQQDLGTLPISTNHEHERRSLSPGRNGKRHSSAEPQNALERAGSLERGTRSGRDARPTDVKRLKQYHRDSASPAPADRGAGWGRGGPQDDEYDQSRTNPSLRARRLVEPSPKPEGPPPQVLHILDGARGKVTGPLPDAVLFFLSILPSAGSFNGPILDAATVVQVIGQTVLPGSAPGDFQGERLGIPPRRKERSPSPPPRRAGGTDYGYGGNYNTGGPGVRSRY